MAYTDFDFLIGDWNVHNRRLTAPLSGSNQWYEFEARSTARHVWGGLANMDEFHAETTPNGKITGMTVRLYDPKSEQWSIYWGSATAGKLGVPTVGAFHDGRGEFFDQEDFNGKSIFVRYTWSKMTSDSAQWDQAFSSDGGQTWESNWIMEFVRR
jgi:hypothetical protein